MKRKSGCKANKIYGNPSGGGGIDSKAYKANSTHGSASGGGGVDNEVKKKNTIHGSGRASASRPTNLTGKTNTRMY